MREIVTYEMEDRGRRRIDYLLDLHDIWSAGLALLTSPGWHNALELDQAKKLEGALELLGYHLTNAYDPSFLAKQINEGMSNDNNAGNLRESQ